MSFLIKGIVFIKNNFCLVFKWMDNGALNSYVRRNRDLSWGFTINFSLFFKFFLESRNLKTKLSNPLPVVDS